MSNFVTRIAGVATLALAILPVVALASNAHGAPRPVKVAVADLDTGSKAGMAAFDKRVQLASRKICSDERTLAGQQNCALGVRLEAREKLTAYLDARSAPTEVAAR
ncbi:MAG: hypothetical protein JWP50_582 [Phenylobacterium sp.]|nr:hypothetical protein [Phenylobacterium sp.]